MIGILEQAKGFGSGGAPIGLEPNTVIGGAYKSITSASVLATKLGIPEPNISLFQIHEENVEAKINVNYSIPSDAFLDDLNIIYFKDFNNLVTSVSNTAFFKAYNTKEIILKGCTNINNGALNSLSLLEVLDIRNVTSLGLTSGEDSVFGGSIPPTLVAYVNTALQTNNGGSPDGDIQVLIDAGCDVRFVLNETKPSAITNFAITTAFATRIEATFTAPSSTNTIDFYEVYVGNRIHSKIAAPNATIFGFQKNTLYEDISIKVVDIYGNKSDFSNKLSFTTGDSAVITQNLAISLAMEETTGVAIDKANGLHGEVNLSVTRGVTGLVNNCFDFVNGEIRIPYNYKLAINRQYGAFNKNIAISYVTFLDTAGSNWFTNKRTVSAVEYQIFYYQGKLNFQVYNSSGTSVKWVKTMTLPTAVKTFWYFHTDIATNQLKVFQNNLELIGTVSGTFSSSLRNLKTDYVFGKAAWTAGLNIDGKADELRTWVGETVPIDPSIEYNNGNGITL